MVYVKSLVYLLGQIVSAIAVFVTALICYPFISRDKLDRIICQWARFNIWTLGWICGITHRVRGVENIPQGPAVIISNHQSAWETLAFQLIFPSQSYLLKRELLWIPVFGWGLAMSRPIAINRARKNRALDTLVKQGIFRLNEGRWLVIFPEGSRMPPGQPAKFQAGGAMIATKSKHPVLPVAHNAGVFWPKRSFVKNPGVVDVIVGEPIQTGEVKTRVLNDTVEQWVNAHLSQLPGINSATPPIA